METGVTKQWDSQYKLEEPRRDCMDEAGWGGGCLETVCVKEGARKGGLQGRLLPTPPPVPNLATQGCLFQDPWWGGGRAGGDLHISKPLLISCPPTQETTYRKLPGASGGARPPVTTFSPSCLKGLGGGGEGQGRKKMPRPSFGTYYLMLLFPTRQAGVSSHHPGQLQATKTTKPSSSVTTSQVGKASPHQCLPYPSPKPLPSLYLFQVLPRSASSWERPP